LSIDSIGRTIPSGTSDDDKTFLLLAYRLFDEIIFFLNKINEIKTKFSGIATNETLEIFIYDKI